MFQEELQKAFDKLRGSEGKYRSRTSKERIADLKRLENALLRDKDQIREALANDLQKPGLEVNYSEIYLVVSEIRKAKKKLRSWMAAKAVGTGIGQIGTRSWVVPEAKGVSLVIAPWNYSISLSLAPVVSAIAAGCPVMLKPSEFTPKASAYMRELIKEIFPDDQAVVFEGDAEVAKSILKMPFRHIFFTGSNEVGKAVMKAATEHLSSVTLELGGKSPVVVDKSASLKEAANRIIFSKWLNAGQTCISCDYVLVERSVSSQFIGLLRSELERLENDESTELCGIVSDKHLRRLKELVEEAVNKGAALIYEGPDTEGKLGIKVLGNPSPEAGVMQEEIFGPVLPIVEIESFDDALRFIAQKETPLSAYLFSSSGKNQRVFLDQVNSGTTCINDVLVHFSNEALPFGGVNESGMGKSHGKYGFDAFSHEKAVLKRTWAFNWIKLVYPPYSNWKEKISNIVLRYF